MCARPWPKGISHPISALKGNECTMDRGAKSIDNGLLQPNHVPQRKWQRYQPTVQDPGFGFTPLRLETPQPPAARGSLQSLLLALRLSTLCFIVVAIYITIVGVQKSLQRGKLVSCQPATSQRTIHCGTAQRQDKPRRSRQPHGIFGAASVSGLLGHQLLRSQTTSTASASDSIQWRAGP